MRQIIAYTPDADSVDEGIDMALNKWADDRDGAHAVIKEVRTWAWESSLLEAARQLAQHDKESREWELALYIYSSSRERSVKDSIKYAELASEESPVKACRIIHNALKKEEEEARLEEIVELCEHANPLFVEQAHKELMQMAIHGNLNALHRLGYSYYWGKSGFEQDWKMAYKWWKKSADSGNEYSMLELSLLLEHGQGVRRNGKKSFQYVKAAADMGLVEAITNLGYCYYWGVGTKKDVSAAIACFQCAIEMGDCVVAAHNLAERYYSGEGVEKNVAQAIMLHQMAAKRGYPDSITRLGYMHIHGEGMPKDVKRGIAMLRKAIKLGGARALCELGKCYERGIGVPQNWEKAMYLYEQSAAKGYNSAKPETARLKRKMLRKQEQISE